MEPVYKHLSVGTDLTICTIDLPFHLQYECTYAIRSNTWKVTNVNDSRGYMIANQTILSKTYIGDFPVAEVALETANTTLSHETVNQPTTTSAATLYPAGYLWNAEVSVNIPVTYVNPFQDLIGHTFTGSLLFKVVMYDQVSRSYRDAYHWDFQVDLSYWLSSATASAARMVGSTPGATYYSIMIGGVIKALPPVTLSFGCGQLQDEAVTSSSYMCYIDINMAGALLGTAVVIEAETQLTARSLPPECQFPGCARVQEWLCTSDDCLGPLCTVSSGYSCPTSESWDMC